MSGRRTWTWTRPPPSAALLLAGALLLPVSAGAQDFRARATTSLRYVELQPVVRDTVSRERVEEAPDGTLLFEGSRVTCAAVPLCTYYRTSGDESALLGTQDLSFTAWGLGVRGLSATGLLRARARLGGDFVWPRSDDHLDLILGYAQLDRGDWRFRVGRQQTLSGLGFQGFDGANVRWAPLREIAVEGYAGRSLARALSEPGREVLRGLEDFIPDRDAWLFGGFVRADLEGGTSVGLRYQRDIWSDRSGLLQERASLDARTGLLRPLLLEGAVDWDVALDVLGKAHLTARYPLPGPGVLLEATVRRYVPYFELSTIWGFFSPVAYHEGLLAVSASPLASTSVQVSAGLRSYEEADAPLILDPLEEDGWRAEARVLSSPREDVTVDARYQLESGVGAFLSSADAHVRWRPREGLEVGVVGTAFQQFLEFRVGEGRVLGGGVTWGVDLPVEVRLDGGAALYRHDPDGRAVNEAWNQLRAWSTISVPLGSAAGEERPRRWRR